MARFRQSAPSRRKNHRHHTAMVYREIVTALIIILALHGLIAFICGFVFLSMLGA